MKQTVLALMASLTLFGLHTQANAQLLGSANTFAVLAGSTVTNTGFTVLSGDLGVWPGTQVTGFPPGVVTRGAIHAGDGAAMQAQADLTTAYNILANEAVNTNLTSQNLGGMTLLPGVYRFNSSASLIGTLTLDAQGDPNASFHFQIGSTLVTATGAAVNVINGGSDTNVYWQVGSSATLGIGTAFRGHILALASITLNTGATILNGSALARTGGVTMGSNTITVSVSVKQFSGHVELQGFIGDATVQPIVIEFRHPGSSNPVFARTVYLRHDGSFLFTTNSPSLPAGFYDVTAKGTHWLRSKLSTVYVAATGASGLDFTGPNFLINGDVDGDNEVSIGDFSLLSAAYNSSPSSPRWIANADLNGDLSVDVGDYAILSTNYSMVGDD